MKKIAILLAGLQTVSFGMRSVKSPEKHSSNSSQILRECEVRFGSCAVSELGKKLSEAVIAEHKEAIEDLIALNLPNPQGRELFVQTIEELFKTKNKNDQKRICALEAEIEKLRASENKNQNTFQDREKDLLALQRENETKNLDKNKTQEGVMRFEKTIAALERELEEAQATLKKASQNREKADYEWRAKFDRLKQDLANTKRALDEKCTRLGNTIASQTLTINVQSDVLGKQKNTIVQLEREIKALKDRENETQDQEINKKKQDELHHRISALERDLGHAQTQLQNAFNNSEKDSGLTISLEQKIKNHETEIEQYKKKLETTQQHNTYLSREIKEQYEKTKKQDALLLVTNSKVSQLENEITNLRNELKEPKEAVKLLGYEHIAPEELLCGGEILREDPKSKQFIKQELERILGKQINRTKYLGDYDSEMDAGHLQHSISNRIANVKGPSTDILLVIHTPGGSIMGAFAEQIYPNLAEGKKGILFGLKKNKHISVVSENPYTLISVRYDSGYLYWGSQEVALKLVACVLSVNCGIWGKTCYNFTNEKNAVTNYDFLTEEDCQKKDNMKAKRIECYQVIFKSKE